MGLQSNVDKFITREERVANDAMGSLTGDKIYHWRKILSEKPPMNEDGTPRKGQGFKDFLKRQAEARTGLTSFINQGIK